MIKKLLAVLILTATIGLLANCTSGGTDENPEGAAVEGEAPPEGDVAAAEAPPGDAPPVDAAAAPPEEAPPMDAPPGDLGAPPPGDLALDAGTPPGDAPPPTLDAGLGGDAGAPPPPPPDLNAGVDTGSTPPADMPPTDTSASSIMGGTTDSTASSPSIIPPDSTPKVVAPLLKIDQSPRMVDGKLLNAVYISRPDDTIVSVSEKIFGSDRSADLKAWNKSLKKKIKPGTKIYYNSATRPDDSSKVLTFYEEQGLPPETYVAQDGDNLKKVAETLLGFPEAWKEIWVTNPVESKGKMPAGTELKYWKGAPAVAKVEPPPVAPPVAQITQPPPPPPQELPTPPPVAAADMQQVQPPPPPPHDEPPPPPPPPAKVAKVSDEEVTSEEEDSMTMAIAGVIVIAALLAFIIYRKKKSKSAFEVQETFAGGGDTQISA